MYKCLSLLFCSLEWVVLEGVIIGDPTARDGQTAKPRRGADSDQIFEWNKLAIVNIALAARVCHVWMNLLSHAGFLEEIYPKPVIDSKDPAL